eukprot:610562-Prorocentrum_minimum.AAC.1
MYGGGEGGHLAAGGGHAGAGPARVDQAAAATLPPSAGPPGGRHLWLQRRCVGRVPRRPPGGGGRRQRRRCEYTNNIASFHGSSCANNGEGALDTPGKKYYIHYYFVSRVLLCQ